MTRTVFRPQLIEFLIARQGAIVTLEELQARMPAGAKASSIRSAMRALIEQGHFEITTLSNGHSWRIDNVTGPEGYGAKPKQTEKAPIAASPILQFEMLGEMADGSVLVRSPAGRLYKLREL